MALGMGLEYFGIMVRVSANGLEHQGSIKDRVIPKTKKIVLDASLIYTRHLKARIKDKGSNTGKEIVPSPIP